MSQPSAQGNIFDAGILRRILKQVGPYRFWFRLTASLVILLAALVWIRPALIGFAIDAFVASVPAEALQGLKSWLYHTTDGWFSSNGEGLLYTFLVVVGLLILEAILQFYQTYLANWVAQSVTLDMRSRLYKHILGFRLKYFDKNPVGTFVTRLVSDIDGVANVFSNGILSVIGDLLKLFVVIAYMLYTNWLLTLIVLVPIPILLVATRIFQKAIKKAFIKVRNQVNKINVFVQEHVTGMNIVQIFHRENKEKERFEEINREHRDANIASIWAFSIFFPIVELLSASSVALLLWWGMRRAVEGTVSLGTLLEFILYVFMLYRPIRQLADRFNVLQMGIVNAERVFNLFDSEEAIAETQTPSLVDTFKGHIKFEDVWFAYNDEDWVLKGVSFEVKPGETLAFVGATGAGKSSVINLISRFYEFQKGKITIDGVDIRELPLATIRRTVAVVLQDVFLFSDSIRNNITLYDARISESDIVESGKAVGAHDFIQRLPGKYDYDVKERGGMLSVGQRQLLAFMRAYVYKPSILVLDEATSSIDTESEELIQKATEKLTEGRTSIVIAHRLSTIQNADRILVMEKGNVVQQGTHASLLKEEGPYKRLFEMQFA
ncbi:MAG: ABC transporter ATP-binding protein/permease [Flavobacteriales bacterium]|nr:ABC transporter ATP-binding protein/permease [Flavobacteriales bacterium]